MTYSFSAGAWVWALWLAGLLQLARLNPKATVAVTTPAVFSHRCISLPFSIRRVEAGSGITEGRFRNNPTVASGLAACRVRAPLLWAPGACTGARAARLRVFGRRLSAVIAAGEMEARRLGSLFALPLEE